MKEPGKFLWIDRKFHTIKMLVDDKELSLEEIAKVCEKTIKDKEEECKTVFYLGASLIASPEAAGGFLYGWLARSIKEKLVSEKKIVHIKHEVETPTKEEIKQGLIEQLEGLINMIKERSDVNNPVVGYSTRIDGLDF